MKQPDTFDADAFVILKQAEKNYFWFDIRRKWIFDTISRFVSPPAKILEVGCGTGYVSSYLAHKGYVVTGCEYYGEALNLAWPGFEKVQGDAVNLPFDDNTFDVVCLFDVIEHFQEDLLLLKEAKRVLKKNGIIALTVPAMEELWSYIDEEAHHKRRYTKVALGNVLSKAGLSPLTMRYLFMSLYFPMKYLRSRKKRWGVEDFRINPMVNRFMKLLFHTERKISKYCPLPLGTSLITIAKREP